jgi:hypothetical protein
MPRFTVRVELHDAEYEPDIYGELHEAMAERKFSRQLTIDGVTYELPPAEYTRRADSLPGSKILKDAVDAAGEVWEDFSVLVTVTEVSRLQHGLKVIKKAK